MCNVSIMCIPHGFKIKKKTDTKIFMEECMIKDSHYCIVIRNDFSMHFYKDKDGNISVAKKKGDLNDIFNPLIEVAATDNCVYKETVEDYIWKYRKYINAKWFNE